MVARNAVRALLLGVLATGIVGASAATLGGLSGASLGSDDQIVAACDDDGITTGYTTAYNAAAQTYQVTAVNFSNVAAACNGKSASVTARQGATALNTTNVASVTVTAGSFAVTLSSPVNVSAVNGVSLVIAG